jgi:hypothetical protein
MGGKRGRPKKNVTIKVEENVVKNEEYNIDTTPEKSDDETVSEMDLTFNGDDDFLEDLDNEHYEIVDE